MIQFFKAWWEKRKLKQAFAEDFRQLIVLAAWSMPEEGKYATLEELESSFFKRGLTQQELEKIKKKIGYVRVE